MELTIDSKDFARIMSRAASVAAAKSPVTMYTMTLLQAHADGRLVARASDSYVGIELSTNCVVKAPGLIAVDAKKTAEIANKLPAGEVSLKLGKAKITCKAGRSKFEIPYVPGDDFPTLPSAGDAASFASMPANELARALSQASYAMAADDTRPHIHATYLEVDGNQLNVVASDGHRMAMAPVAIDGTCDSALVPFRGVGEVRKLCESAKTGTVRFTNLRGYAFFTTDAGVLSVRVVDQSFVPWRKMMRAKNKAEVSVMRDAIVEAIDRVSVAAEKKDKGTSQINLTFSAGQISIATEHGDAIDVVECDCDFDAVVGVNPRYIVEALKSSRNDEVTIGLNGHTDPINITPASGTEFAAVVMTMRVGQ